MANNVTYYISSSIPEGVKIFEDPECTIELTPESTNPDSGGTPILSEKIYFTYEKVEKDYFYIKSASGDECSVTIDGSSLLTYPSDEVTGVTDFQLWYSAGNGRYDFTENFYFANGASSFTLTFNRDSKGKAYYFKGKLKRGSNDVINFHRGVLSITCTKPCEIGGNIMSIIVGDDFENEDIVHDALTKRVITYRDPSGQTHERYSGPEEWLFRYMFKGSNVSDASMLKLPDITVKGIYSEMFCDCGGLEAAPTNLPAKKVSECGYMGMFSGCTNLTYVSNIAATELENYACQSMFASCCEKLEVGPVLSFEKVGVKACSEMFNACTKMKTIGMESFLSENATVPTSACYWMFNHCEELTQIIKLPALNLGDHCYEKMFYYCKALELPEDYTLPAESVEESSYSEMFGGCLNLTNMPIIGASNSIKKNGCKSMFSGCKNLKNTTTLNAEILYEGAYSAMFNGCSSIKKLRMLATKIYHDGGIQNITVDYAGVIVNYMEGLLMNNGPSYGEEKGAASVKNTYVKDCIEGSNGVIDMNKWEVFIPF